MRVLIAISSCYDFERNGNNQALRDTWLPDLRHHAFTHYKFFFGSGQGAESNPLPDAVVLPDVPDDYGHLTYKTQASLRWAAERNYDFVFRCFADTYVRVDRLMSSGFEQYDYMGDFRNEEGGLTQSDPQIHRPTLQEAQNYASGGPGYFLSKRAYSLLLEAPILGLWRDDLMPYVEDMWVGNILGRHLEIPLKYFDDTHRFVNKGSNFWPTRKNQVIASHLSCPDRYRKETMYAAHQEWIS